MHLLTTDLPIEWECTASPIETPICTRSSTTQSIHLTTTTYVGRFGRIADRHFRSWWRKWSVAASAACECDAEDQTVNYVVLHCPIHRPPHGLHGLTVLDYETIRLAVDHLPRDLVRPSSGLQELAQTMMMKQLVLACCRHSHLNKPCCAVFCVMNGLMMKTWFFIHSFSSPIPPWNKFPPRNQRFLPWWVRWLLFEKHWSRASTSKLSMLAI